VFGRLALHRPATVHEAKGLTHLSRSADTIGIYRHEGGFMRQILAKPHDNLLMTERFAKQSVDKFDK